MLIAFKAFSSGSTLSVKMLLFGLFVDQYADNTAMDMWRVVTWSLHWLYMGVWPPVDWYGRAWTETHRSEKELGDSKLADGLFGVLFSLKGDLDYFAKNLKLRHYNANLMCDLCPANRCVDDRTLLYNNFSEDAAWKTQTYDAAAWRLLYLGKFLHWVFNLVG